MSVLETPTSKTIKHIGIMLLIVAPVCFGRYQNGINWADKVENHTELIQKYGGGSCGGPGPALLDPNTPSNTWVLLGENDSDTNDNMFAWDDCDRDYVAGWRGGTMAAQNQEITVWFGTPLTNIAGQDDLRIRAFCGPLAKASVLVSSDGEEFVEIGIIEGIPDNIPGTPGYFCDVTFDFGNITNVHYVRVHRINCFAQSGMFFDSFGSVGKIIPESQSDIKDFGWALDGDINKDSCIDMMDFAAMNSQMNKYNDPENVPGENDTDPDFVDFPDPRHIPSTCHGVWQSGLGLVSDINQDCYVDENDLLILAENWLSTNNPQDTENPGFTQNWQ